LLNGFAASMLGSWAAEVKISRWVILASTGVCVAISIIYLNLVNFLPTFVIWFSILVMESGLGLIGYVLYNLQIQRSELDSDYDIKWIGFTSLWLLTFLLIIFSVILFKHLKIAINIISVTADWLSDARGIIMVPISFLLIGLVILTAWMLAMISIGSMSSTPI
jgi:hypothetical protein